MAFKVSKKRNTRAPLARKRPSSYSSESSGGERESTGSSKRSPSRKRADILTIILIVVALIVFSVSLFNLVVILLDYRVAGNEYKTIDTGFTSVDENSGMRRVNYRELTQTNGDFVAWIDIPGTNISYPVVYSPISNDVYLRTTFLGQSATAGSIFIDSRCTDYFSSRVTIIYGHRMNDNTMFAQLKNFLTKDFWEEHREIHIYMESGIEIYKVFSSYTATTEDDCYTFHFESDQAFIDWGKIVSGRSNYNTGISLKPDSRVIILSTCVYGQEDNRNVVLAVYDHTLPNPA